MEQIKILLAAIHYQEHILLSKFLILQIELSHSNFNNIEFQGNISTEENYKMVTCILLLLSHMIFQLNLGMILVLGKLEFHLQQYTHILKIMLFLLLFPLFLSISEIQQMDKKKLYALSMKKQVFNLLQADTFT